MAPGKADENASLNLADSDGTVVPRYVKQLRRLHANVAEQTAWTP